MLYAIWMYDGIGISQSVTMDGTRVNRCGIQRMFAHVCRNRVFNREEGSMYIRTGTKGTDLVGHVSRTLMRLVG